MTNNMALSYQCHFFAKTCLCFSPKEKVQFTASISVLPNAALWATFLYNSLLLVLYLIVALCEEFRSYKAGNIHVFLLHVYT